MIIEYHGLLIIIIPEAVLDTLEDLQGLQIRKGLLDSAKDTV